MDLICISDWLPRRSIGKDESLLARWIGCRIINRSGSCCWSRWGSNTISILERRGHGGYRQPIHWFRLNPCHYGLSLELSDLLSQISVGTLGVVIRLKRHVPWGVVSKFTWYEPRTVLARKKILEIWNRGKLMCQSKTILIIIPLLLPEVYCLVFPWGWQYTFCDLVALSNPLRQLEHLGIRAVLQWSILCLLSIFSLGWNWRQSIWGRIDHCPFGIISTHRWPNFPWK